MTDNQSNAVQTGTILGEDGLRRPPWAARDPLLRDYYDTEWGMPVHDEAGLFERLVLEGFQSGLSWVTILRKRPAFREAFAGFDPDAVAAFGGEDVARLMADERLVRNRRKIDAAVTNARATVALRSGRGGGGGGGGRRPAHGRGADRAQPREDRRRRHQRPGDGGVAVRGWARRADLVLPAGGHAGAADDRRGAEQLGGVDRAGQGAQAARVHLCGSGDHLRADGGHRGDRHPPGRFASTGHLGRVGSP